MPQAKTADSSSSSSSDAPTDNLKEVVIAHRSFPYMEEIDHPYEPGKTVYNDRVAYRGDSVKVFPRDYERGVRLGSFLKKGQTVEDLSTGGKPPAEFSAIDATDTELIEWIKNEGPTAQQVVDASEGDAETADRLLSAENAATGNDPRKAVVAGLEAVIVRSGE